MAYNRNHFLVGNEASKPFGIGIGVRQDNRDAIFPADALGTREEFLQEGFLGAHFHLNVAIAQAWSTATFAEEAETSHCLLGISLSFKLDVAIHGLRTGPIHDHVNRSAFLR